MRHLWENLPDRVKHLLDALSLATILGNPIYMPALGAGSFQAARNLGTGGDFYASPHINADNVGFKDVA